MCLFWGVFFYEKSSIKNLGPLTADDHEKVVLVGLTSTGQACAHPIFPGIFARISTNMDWILENSDAAEWQCQK